MNPISATLRARTARAARRRTRPRIVGISKRRGLSARLVPLQPYSSHSLGSGSIQTAHTKALFSSSSSSSSSTWSSKWSSEWSSESPSSMAALPNQSIKIAAAMATVAAIAFYDEDPPIRRDSLSSRDFPFLGRVLCSPNVVHGRSARITSARHDEDRWWARSRYGPFDNLKQLSPTYSVDRVIGTGGFGSVRIGHNTETGQPVALKFLLKSETSKHELKEEVELQRAVHAHRGVNTVLDVCQTPREWVVVMEYLSGGELFDKLIASGAYSEREASKALRTVCSTISHLHSNGIVHGDIKPENIMLQNEDRDADLELIDFGMAFRLEPSSGETHIGVQQDERIRAKPEPPKNEGEETTSQLPIDLLIRKRDKKRQRRMTNAHRLGTTAYAPPEVLQSNPVGEGVDMWALGVITYILLSGTHPFDLSNDASDEQIEHNIISNNLSFDDPVWESVSPSAIELIRLLLAQDANDRPSAEEALEHPWLAEDAYERLGAEPLTEVAKNLTRYQRGRRYLRASVLAVLLGIADVKQQESSAMLKTIGDESTVQENRLSADSSNSIMQDKQVLNQESGESESILPKDGFNSLKKANQEKTLSSKPRQNKHVRPHIGRRGSTTLDVSRKAWQREANIHRGGAYSAQPLDRNNTKSSTSKSVLSRDTGPEKFSVYQRLRRFDRDNKGFITHQDLRMVTSELGHELTEEEILDMADSTSMSKIRETTVANNDGKTKIEGPLSENITASKTDLGNATHARTVSELVSDTELADSDNTHLSIVQKGEPVERTQTEGDLEEQIHDLGMSRRIPRKVSEGGIVGESKKARNSLDLKNRRENSVASPPTSAMGHKDIQRILKSLRTQRFGQGDIISREGQVERIWHLLLDGKVEMSQRNAYGKNVIMNHVFPGEHFGAWELMSPDGQAKPRRKTGRCVADLCEVLTLPQSDLEVLTNTFEKVRERMARQSRMRTREMLRSYLRAELVDYKEVTYEAGEVVYAQGDVCDSFFIVLDGEVDVTRESTGDSSGSARHSVVVEQLGEGDFFPLGVLGIGGLRKNTRGATVSARVRTRVARVSGEALRNFAETRVSTEQIAVVADLAEDLIERHEMRAKRGGFSSTLVHDEENGREDTSFPVHNASTESAPKKDK